MLWVALHFSSLPAGMLESIASWACQFTPKVSLEPPHALIAEVAGSLRYFGGKQALLRDLRRGLSELGFEAEMAMAPTPRAALWRARGGGQAVAQLPLEAMDLDVGFLKSIGLVKVGDLLSLPRDGLAKRCGQEMLAGLDQALGLVPEPREFFVPPARFAANLELPGEVAHAAGVLFAARRLLVQLAGLLSARQAGVRRFTLTLSHRKKAFTGISVDFASPTRDIERFVRLLRERLAAVSLKEPVEGIRLEAAGFAPLHARTAGMFGDAVMEDEAWAQLVERLRARLGHAAVYGLATQPDHRPEHAWRRIEPGDWDPREFAQPGPRPAWLLEQPRRVAPTDFRLLAGPERIECGWWDADEAKRDYFVAQDRDAALIWVYREATEWYLHGLFA